MTEGTPFIGNWEDRHHFRTVAEGDGFSVTVDDASGWVRFDAWQDDFHRSVPFRMYDAVTTRLAIDKLAGDFALADRDGTPVHNMAEALAT